MTRSTTGAPLLGVEEVSKRFGTTQALAGVTLEAARGELVVVLGPTGVGKTTLLRTIAGLETPDAGRIRFDGADATGLPPSARDVALVFQNFSLYPRWTVRQNLEFPLQAPGRGIPLDEIEPRVAWAAELLKIDHLLERDSRRLSGGEMQRVALGRALVRRPRLFLMDEPLSNLDAKLREALRVEIAALVRELGTPMIYVTHDQSEALSMATRIVVLERGRVLQSGSPQQVYQRPVSPAVARQLGHPPINIVRVRRAEGMWAASDRTPLAPAPADAPPEALLGIRPEHVWPEGGSTPAVVELVEDAGHAKIVVAHWAGETVRLLVERSFAVEPGAALHPRLDSDHVIEWPSQP